MPWFDSHCHVSYDGVGEAAIDEARAGGVARIVTIGTDAAHSRAAIDVAHAHDDVWATVGLHPHDAVDGVAGLMPLLDEEKVVAVGECGLDYHYDHSPRDVQRAAFAEQIRVAHARDLALVVHTREAWDDTFAILEDEGVPTRTVFHCFTGGPDEAERALALSSGTFISFSGVVTFKNAEDVRAAATSCPLERIVVETDAPYLAPVPHRGQTNRPAWVAVVGAAIATVKGLDRDAVEAVTWDNANRLFRLT
ncbi:MAG: putative deoxyribonuclease [Acidimicrobiales bacterium]|jgi:TatD DNase family protein|nr:putative deoxyribonuclease [Acidimicrobiales bacterium]